MQNEHTSYVYIMASKSGTIYVGVTNNIERRVYEHKTGFNKGFTKKYGCKKLAYYEEIGNIGEAILREKEIKGWSRWKKERLIRSQNPTWFDLAFSWFDPEDLRTIAPSIRHDKWNCPTSAFRVLFEHMSPNFERPSETVEAPQPIEIRDVKERKRLLDHQIIKISLRYAEKQYRKKKDAGESITFSQMVDEYTPIRSYLTFGNNERTRLASKTIINVFFDKLDEDYEQEGLDGIRDRFLAASIGKKQDEEKQEDPKITPETPVFIKANTHNLSGGYAFLEERMDLRPDERVMEIHVQPAHEVEGVSLGLQRIKKDFELLATNIIRNYPDVQAVAGTSWLLDTPLGKRFGFHTVPEIETKMNSFNTWNQFITEDGQIDKRRLQDFAETGKLPYKSTVGYMPIEEFLEKYLPDDLRGEVRLRRRTTHGSELEKTFKASKEEASKEWGTLVSQENVTDEDVNTLLKKHECFRLLFELVGESNHQTIVRIFQENAKKKTLMDQFDWGASEEEKALNELAQKNFSKLLYEDRIVHIPPRKEKQASSAPENE